MSGLALNDARAAVHSLWRGNRLWAALLSASFIGRTALDWLVPPADFHTRSVVSTAIGVGILLCAGFWATWRSDSLRSGALAGVATTLIAACISAVGAAALLAIWHDPSTLAAISGSGGLGEVFTLPVTMIVPGAFLGTLGGTLGGMARRVTGHSV